MFDRRAWLSRWKLSEGGVVAPDERLPAAQTLALGLQHVVAMFGATVLAPLLMGFDPNDFLKWQLGSRLLSGSFAMPFVNDTRLLVRRGMVGATGNLYVGLQEFEDMAFILHLLRPEDLFIDVGANVGAYTLLAGAAGARCVAFEPVPATFRALRDNVRLNALQMRVCTEMCCVGRAAGRTAFTTCYDAMNHVLSDRDSAHSDAIGVDVRALDDALNGENPIALKIDVEGFETEVLRGATTTLRAENLIAVLLELNGSGVRYDYDESAIHVQMLGVGFKPHRYEPFQRSVTEIGTANSTGNTLYLRRIERVRQRVQHAPTFLVKGISI
jgi:FkbM family methyltransferase